MPATRHLKDCAAFGALADVSVLTPGVLGTTGLEAAELVRGAVETVRPDLVVAVDALASQSLGRVCTTVQLTDAGIVPGSGVGNHRRALTRETLGVPVLAVGVPTVVDAATLALDLLDEAGADLPDPARPARTGERHGHARATSTRAPSSLPASSASASALLSSLRSRSTSCAP